MIITILAGLFVLSAVIIVHEFGHFFVAKLSGVFVKTFSIGFGRKILKKRFGETQYAISILPFGGYVKFAGEAEASSKDEKEPPSDEELSDRDIDPKRYFRQKRVLIRSAVVLAGPLMNYVLAVAIYISVFLVQGLQVIPATTIGEVKVGSPADSVGLEAGDRILAVDGTAVDDWGDVLDRIVEDKENLKILKISRNDSLLDIPFKSGMKDGYIVLGFYAHLAPKIGRVKKDSPAERSGMQIGTIIKAINDTTVNSYYDVERIIHEHPSEPLVIKWTFNNIEHEDTLIPEAKKVLKEGSKTETTIVGQIGVGPFYAKEPVGFFPAVRMGYRSSKNMTLEILSFLKLLFTGKAGVDSLGGPIMITQMAGDMARWGFNYLLYFLAFFSINLSIFNLLPVLPFDGGHLFFFVIEGITRRKVKDRVREVLSQVGFILLIILMIFVVVMDISRCSGTTPGVL